MKSLIIIIAILSSFSAFASDWKSNLDSAESSLRIILNRPANEQQLPSAMLTEEKRLEAMAVLMNIEMRHPGLLKGKLDLSSDWPQYINVQKLFSELEEKMGFWY